MDYQTWMRIKRAQILAGITTFRDEKKLDRKDTIVRDLFAGNPVIVREKQQNTVCCNAVEPPPVSNCPPPIIVDECPQPMHQF